MSDDHQDGTRPVGARERNRQALRRKLSDTATAMFLERGFNAVRVSDIAEACGVSTKTVWNHFPTKESLIHDRGERLAAVLDEAANAPRGQAGANYVLVAVAACIQSEISALDGGSSEVGRDSDVTTAVQAFARLVGANSALRAATAERVEQLTDSAARAVARHSGLSVDSAHVHLLAGALISLWRLHLSGILRLGDGGMTSAEVRERISADLEVGVEFAAALFDRAPQA